MQKRSSIIAGIILILVGALFLLVQLFPGLAEQMDIGQQWPLLIVALGLLFITGALLSAPPLAVPGSVITGIGALLYYQNLTGNWESWAYAWTLIPGFAGAGIILMKLIGGEPGRGVREGGRLVLISLALFILFGAFFGGLGGLSRYWPVILILVGIWLLLKSVLRR